MPDDGDHCAIVRDRARLAAGIWGSQGVRARQKRTAQNWESENIFDLQARFRWPEPVLVQIAPPGGARPAHLSRTAAGEV
jgi:hypothetical protein